MNTDPKLVTVRRMQYKGLNLFPFQEEAIRSIDSGSSVIVSAPTGAGKTIIAEYAIDRALAENTRVIYTSPIKALSNQKYRDFRDEYGEKVGIMTGDVTINASAPIIIMTTEIFRNTIFESESRLQGVRYVIFDEVHYLGDPDRGSVWEESIIFAPPSVRFIALSATISNLDEIRDWMSSILEGDVKLVHTDDRPVPLHRHLFLEDIGVIEPKKLKEIFPKAKEMARNRRREQQRQRRGRQRPRRGRPQQGKNNIDIIKILIRGERLPTLYFSFSRKKCEILAQRYSRRTLLTHDEESQVLSLYDDLVNRYGIADNPAVGKMRRSAQRGVLYHHAGMLPVFKDIVERLFSSGFVKLLFTTETFALGVNMPAKCVVFDSLTKWNGIEIVHITPLDFRQMSGRAGRQGIDREGEVYSIVDTRYDTPGKVKEILYKRPDAIFSMFSLGYATILNLKNVLKNEVETAVKKSFSVFQRKSDRIPLENLRRKTEVLASRKYLDGDELTDKGRFCSQLAGFEVHLTELYWEGCFEGLDPLQCAVLCCAIVYEPRKTESTPDIMINPLPDVVVRRAQKRIRQFQKAELTAKLPDTARPLDFGLSAAIAAWIEGESFSELQRYASMQDGDLVRVLRLTIQVLRQLAWTLPADNPVAEACGTALGLLNRDEVDAERQLKVQ